MSIVGDRIKAARLARGISQEELGEKSGYTRSGISKIEVGKNEPNRDSLVKIAKALGVSVSYLLDVDDGVDQALQNAFDRPEMKILFSVTKDCSKDEIEQAIKIIEALKK